MYIKGVTSTTNLRHNDLSAEAIDCLHSTQYSVDLEGIQANFRTFYWIYSL